MTSAPELEDLGWKLPPHQSSPQPRPCLKNIGAVEHQISGEVEGFHE